MVDLDIQKWPLATGRTSSSLDQTREGWSTPLKFRPSQSWQYGSGIDWAGLVLEKVTGQRLEAYMSEKIFKPLNMKETTFNRQSIANFEIQTAHSAPAPCPYLRILCWAVGALGCFRALGILLPSYRPFLHQAKARTHYSTRMPWIRCFGLSLRNSRVRRCRTCWKVMSHSQTVCQ